MLEFKPVTVQSADTLRKYYENCDFQICDYSVGTKLMWVDSLKYEYAEAEGCLIVRNHFRGYPTYDYPVAGPDGDEDAALCAIEEQCRVDGIAPVISIVPETKACKLLARYPYVQVSNIRTWQDYIYKRSDLAEFAGRRYSGQRNHIKKFKAAYPKAALRKLTSSCEDQYLIDGFWKAFEAENPKAGDPKAQEELAYAKRVMKLAGESWARAAGFMLDGKLIAIELAEKCRDTLIIHIEKALYSYEGVYPALVQAFAAEYGEDSEFINREDDAADKGLRTSKTQYRPVKMAQKLVFEPENDLKKHVSEIPELKTERLTLSAITEDDADDYNAIVLDKDRNTWWGYDDEGNLGEERNRLSFLNVARNDFENNLAINFAIRLDGKMIGEAVLYDFDYKGGAELGVRIASEYAGAGYGAESFKAVADWALYKVHMRRIFAKCYHENEASAKMLSKSMRKIGENEKFTFFERLI